MTTIEGATTTDVSGADEEKVNVIRRIGKRWATSLSSARSSLFWALLRRQKKTLTWLFIVMIVGSVGLLMTQNLIRGMVDNGVVDQTGPLWPYVTHILFWALWSMVFYFIQQQLGERLSYAIEFDLRAWLYTHVQSADLRSLDKVATGQLTTRSLTDIQLVEQLLRVFPTLIGFAPLLIAMSVIVIISSPLLGVIAIAALPINIFFVSRFIRPLRALSWSELNERAEVARAIDEPVRGIRVVKAFGREQQEIDRVSSVTARAYRYSMTRVRLLSRYDGKMKAIPLFCIAALLATGAWLLDGDRVSLGTFLIAFQLCVGLSRLASVFDELTSAWTYLRSAQDRLAEMLGLSSRPVTDGRMIPPPTTGLALQGVEVRYGTRRLLGGLDLNVGLGEFVVVHGAPGTGKSTLAGIASGLLIADDGTASLDGIEMLDLDQAELRRTVRVVSEEPLLLASSLRDNLLLGAFGDITDDDLVEAMSVAGADEVIAELEGGLDGSVGDRGLTVSGGQRQRISLARALVARPRVLILDDALSAVNPALEVEIMRRVRRYLPESAILYITRRVGLVEVADRALELLDPDDLSPQQVPEAAAAALPTPDAGVPLTANVSGILGDPVDAIDAIEELGQSVEREVDVRNDGSRVDTSGLAKIDPLLAKMIDQLQVTSETPRMGDEYCYTDEPPKFFSLLGAIKGFVALAILLTITVALATIAPDIIFGQITDIVGSQASGNLEQALPWAGLVVLIGVALGFLAWRQRIAAMQVTQNVVIALRRRVFYRLTKLGVNYYDRELPGDVATRVVADLDKLLSFMQGQGFILLSSLTITIVGLSVIVIMAPPVFVVVLGILAAIIIVSLIQLPIANRAFGWSREELQVVTRRFQEDFTARHEIRNLGARAIQTQKYIEACWDRRRARWWAATVQNAQSSVINFIAIMSTPLVLWKAGELVLRQEMSLGTALAVAILANTATLPLRTLGSLYNALLDVRVSWKRLYQPFETEIFPIDGPDVVECPHADGIVSFEDVAFTYPNTNRQILKGTSFTMQPGKVTALVGYTGAGKSSIAKLLMRTYDPDGGRITVNGTDVRDYRSASYRATLGIVPQDPFLFKGTVAHNLRYGNPDATDAEIDAAVRSVGAWDLLSTLPGAFEFGVEEEGHNLTAAQRQLIALARAWLAKPDILVLDEATSLLDHRVEDQIIAAVHELGCTTLMITHRENVAQLADNIVVLESGVVVDEGPEEIVARVGGPYDRLWRVQEDELAAEKDQELAGT